MSTLKIRKVGNSLGVIFPSDVVDAIHVKEGDELHVSVSRDRPDTLQLSAMAPDDAKILDASREVRRSDRGVFKKLANR